MSGDSSIQFYHSLPSNVEIRINKIRYLKELQTNQLSKLITLTPSIHSIKIVNKNTKKIIYNGKLPLLSGQQIILFPLLDNNCLSVLNMEQVPDNEVIIRFINLTHLTLNLSVTKGDIIFEGISFMQISNSLLITPMIIDLEIREANNIIKKIPKVHFKPNYSYFIIMNEMHGINILELS